MRNFSKAEFQKLGGRGKPSAINNVTGAQVTVISKMAGEGRWGGPARVFFCPLPSLRLNWLQGQRKP